MPLRLIFVWRSIRRERWQAFPHNRAVTPEAVRRTITITWPPRATHHFKELNSAAHVNRLVRRSLMAPYD